MKVVVLSCLIMLTFGSNFDIVSTSTCTAIQNGFCTRWEQNGTVQEQLGSCFPANTRLITPNGPLSMQDLKKGDEVLGWVNGKEQFVKITSWFHRLPATTSEYLKLNTENGWMEVSAKHNLASKTREYRFAEEAESLFPSGNVESVSKVVSLGVYAPKTTSNNYFVLLEDSSNQGKALAHCYAHVRNPELYDGTVDLIEAIWDFFGGEWEGDIHPSTIWLEKSLKILQE